MTWNPRYLAYCKAHGNTPEEQKVVDPVPTQREDGPRDALQDGGERGR